jgi:SAM-dependent methyltransferase
MYRVRRHVFLRMARPLVPEDRDAAVLDIGSGTGFYVERWRELGVTNVVASDLTDVAVSRLGGMFPGIESRRLDITAELPAELVGRFAAVSVMDVLFHVVDDGAYERAIANLGRLVRPGGHVILSENLLRGPEQRGRHQVSRTRERIEGLLAGASLEVRSRAPMFVLMNTPVNEPGRLHRAAWDQIAAAAGRGPKFSAALGAALYPLELALVSVVRQGPSTEVVVCRRGGSTSS